MDLIKKIILSRHGSTIYNDKELLQGISDIPLSEKGIHESELLAEHLKNEKIEKIYHTPLIRTKQTAEFVNKYHNVQMECIDSFIEMDMGEWEGCIFPEFIKSHPDFYRQWVMDPNVGLPGGESFGTLYTRVNSGIQILLDPAYSSILLVAHAMVNRAILGNLLHMDPLASRHFRSGNCSISRLSVYGTEGESYVAVDTWNDTSHIKKAGKSV